MIETELPPPLLEDMNGRDLEYYLSVCRKPERFIELYVYAIPRARLVEVLANLLSNLLPFTEDADLSDVLEHGWLFAAKRQGYAGLMEVYEQKQKEVLGKSRSLQAEMACRAILSLPPVGVTDRETCLNASMALLSYASEALPGEVSEVDEALAEFLRESVTLGEVYLGLGRKRSARRPPLCVCGAPSVPGLISGVALCVWAFIERGYGVKWATSCYPRHAHIQWLNEQREKRAKEEP